MIWIFYITLGFSLVRLAVVLANVFTKPYFYKLKNTAGFESMISVLIPARNEEENILSVLQDIKDQTYKNLEIIVLDDNSEDNTFQLVSSFFNENSSNLKVKIIKGEHLPNGWLGKNWACHQLQKYATGEFLLFIDADVKLAPEAMESAYIQVRKNGLDLLSLFPDQLLNSIGEKLVVPFMHFILLTLLPLRLIRTSKNPAFAAANGQFMFFKKASYNNWHKELKNVVTEDIAILKAMKAKGFKTETLLGNKLVFCRMYNGFNDAMSGFSKNLFAGFGNNSLIISMYFLLTLIFPVFIFFMLPIQYFLIISIAGIFLKTGVSFLAKYNLAEQSFFHPMQICVWFWLGILSVYKTYTKQNKWKGRRI